jgi:hypothetical protein
MNGKVWDIKTKAGAKYLDSSAVGLTAEEKEAEADAVMARCLGDGRWLEEKLGKKGGEWILMRWKGESPKPNSSTLQTQSSAFAC